MQPQFGADQIFRWKLGTTAVFEGNGPNMFDERLLSNRFKGAKETSVGMNLRGFIGRKLGKGIPVKGNLQNS